MSDKLIESIFIKTGGTLFIFGKISNYFGVLPFFIFIKSLKLFIMDDSQLAALNNAASSMTQAAAVINGANSTRKQRKWMEKMYEQQRQWQLADRADARRYALDMWNLENDYKHPISQLARMVQSGINPNNAAPAIAGVSSSAAPSQPLYQPLPSMPTPYNDVTSQVLSNAALNFSQLANINAQTSKMKAETSQIEAETKKTYVDTDQARQQLKASVYDFENLMPERVRELRSIIEKNISDVRLNDAEVNQMVELTKRTVKEIERVDSEIKRFEADIALNKERVKSEQTSQEKDKAEAALARSSDELNQSKKKAQDLLNGYEEELQTFGTSTSASSNPVVNAKDQAAIMAGRAVKNAPKNKTKARRRFPETSFRSMSKPFSSDWRDELGH